METGTIEVFTESGPLHAVEERLLALAARPAPTLVVAPLDGTVDPPGAEGRPYRALPGLVDLAARSRSQPSEDLDRFLTQPFHVSAHELSGTAL